MHLFPIRFIVNNSFSRFKCILSYLYSVFRLLSRGLHTPRCQVRYTDTKRLLKRMFIHPFFPLINGSPHSSVWNNHPFTLDKHIRCLSHYVKLSAESCFHMVIVHEHSDSTNWKTTDKRMHQFKEMIIPNVQIFYSLTANWYYDVSWSVTK